MILGLVAPFSQSMSSFRATATHFVPETMILDVLQTLKCINWTYKSKCYSTFVLQMQNLCIANTKKGYKGSDYILQIQNICIANTETLYKCSDYILQIYKLFVLNTKLYIANTYLSVANIEMCVFYQFGATGAVPAGAFFQQK